MYWIVAFERSKISSVTNDCDTKPEVINSNLIYEIGSNDFGHVTYEYEYLDSYETRHQTLG